MNEVMEQHRRAIRTYLQSEFTLSKVEAEGKEKYQADLKAMGEEFAAKKDPLSKLIESIRKECNGINQELQKIDFPLLSIRKENVTKHDDLSFEVLSDNLRKISWEVNSRVRDINDAINQLKQWRLKRGARIALLVISGIVGFIILCWIGTTIVAKIRQPYISTQNLLRTQTDQALLETRISQTPQTILATQTMQASFVTVSANIEWQKTIFNIQQGDTVQINSQNQWSNDSSLHTYDANGLYIYPDTILSTANLGALIAKIGDCEPFLIGTHSIFQASCTGSLYLAMNDVLGKFDDNIGEQNVQILINP
jgi:hypothetical protein